MNKSALKLLFAIVCLCFASDTTIAQCPNPLPLNITANLYNQENGLASNMLAGIAKDSIGYRYFLGVDGKWIRYDGVNFSVKNVDVFSIDRMVMQNLTTANYSDQYIGNVHYKYAKEKGAITYKWGINGNSLIWVNLAKNVSEAYPFPKEIIPNQATGFYPEGEVCWITNTEYVFRFDIRTKKFRAIARFPNDKMKAVEPLVVMVIKHDYYLIVENEILKWNSVTDAFEKFCTVGRFPIKINNAEVIMNKYLFISESYNLYEVNLDNAVVKKTNLITYTGIKNSTALTIVALRNFHNNLLIATSNSGLLIYNRCSDAMQNFQYSKPNTDVNLTNSIVWIVDDDENVIWMQTEAGLIKLEVNNQQIKTYRPSVIKNGGLCNECNNVRAIYPIDSNNLLIGTLGGVYNLQLKSGVFTTFKATFATTPLLKDRQISAITGDENGTIFIASWGNEGVYLINNKKKKLVNILPQIDHPELAFANIRCLYYDAHHVLWIGTNMGFLKITNLDEFQKNNFTGKLNVTDMFTQNPQHVSPKAGACFAITGDQWDNIWLGTTDGLFKYNYKTDAVVSYIQKEGNNTTLSNNEVRSICVSDADNVWIGTNNGGLNHLDCKSNTFTSYTTANGLPNNSIYTILESTNGFLWLGTNGGLYRFNKTDHSIRSFTPRDGVQNYEFNTNASAITYDGNFCFGGRTGFNIFSPDSMNTTEYPPKAVITKFKIFDTEFPVTDAILELPHNQNSFTFDFAALNYYRSNDNQYTYILEGADKQWIKSGNRQYTSYTNLPPGDYTFKVRAANYTGAWNNNITTIKFIINPAWYTTWWFRMAIVFLITGSIYVLYRYRLRQMMKLHIVRNRIASDLHDEIGSTLGSISLSSALIQSKLNSGNTDVMPLLNQVSTNSSNMMEALSDIVWAINTRNDRFDNVVNRMRAFAIELLEPSNIIIHFNVSDDSQLIQLDMQQRKNLYLIFKEAINNISKYASCKNVIIAISRIGNKMFVMDIKDDGNGFYLTELNHGGKSLSGNGIRNMKKRAEELNGELIIKSAPGEGTILNLKFGI